MNIPRACQESGHWWGDEPFILKFWKRKRVGERFQTCQRGCGRTRTSRISVSTGDLIGSHVYGGRVERYAPGAPKAAIRREMIEESNK